MKEHQFHLVKHEYNSFKEQICTFIERFSPFFNHWELGIYNTMINLFENHIDIYITVPENIPLVAL